MVLDRGESFRKAVTRSLGRCCRCGENVSKMAVVGIVEWGLPLRNRILDGEQVSGYLNQAAGSMTYEREICIEWILVLSPHDLVQITTGRIG